MTNKRLDSLVSQIEGKCVHFNGIMNDCCKANVNYQELAGRLEGMALVIPCLPEEKFEKERREKFGETIRECSKLQRVTHEEALKQATEMIESSTRTMKAMRAAHDAAKEAGLGKGRGGIGMCPCPLCSGSITYSVASCNGHMHARCSTPNCVRWME